MQPVQQDCFLIAFLILSFDCWCIYETLEIERDGSNIGVSKHFKHTMVYWYHCASLGALCVAY